MCVWPVVKSSDRQIGGGAVAEVNSGLTGRTRGLLFLAVLGAGIGIGYVFGSPVEGGLWGLIAGFIITRLGQRGGG